MDKLESAEEAFLNTEFLAPVLPGGRVRVRIAGLVCTLRVIGPAEPGWAILKPISLAGRMSSPRQAHVRSATTWLFSPPSSWCW